MYIPQVSLQNFISHFYWFDEFLLDLFGGVGGIGLDTFGVFAADIVVEVDPLDADLFILRDE